MNRRSFLSFLGLAPVAAVLPAAALARPEATKSIGMVGEIGPEFNLPDVPQPLIMQDGMLHMNTANIEPLTVTVKMDTAELREMMDWIARDQRKMLAANMRKAKRRGLL